MPSYGLAVRSDAGKAECTLRDHSLELVFDALLEVGSEGKSAPTAVTAIAPIQLEDSIGTYVANFVTLRDEPFEVLIHGARLALDLPSQKKTDLDWPDNDGKWFSSQSDQLAVSSETIESGLHLGDEVFLLDEAVGEAGAKK